MVYRILHCNGVYPNTQKQIKEHLEPRTCHLYEVCCIACLRKEGRTKILGVEASEAGKLSLREIHAFPTIIRIEGDKERYYPDVIKQRYNNYSEVIFWGYFTYDAKGLCHVYHKETEEQKEANQAEMEAVTARLLI